MSNFSFSLQTLATSANKSAPPLYCYYFNMFDLSDALLLKITSSRYELQAFVEVLKSTGSKGLIHILSRMSINFFVYVCSSHSSEAMSILFLIQPSARAEELFLRYCPQLITKDFCLLNYLNVM